MDALDGLAARFEASRPRLHAVTYRMLGPAAEALLAASRDGLSATLAERNGLDADPADGDGSQKVRGAGQSHR